VNHPDASGMTPLMTAAYNGQEKIVRSLVEFGADINHIVEGQEGAASALQAVLDTPDFQEEHLRVMNYLLEKGADVKGRNSAGRFPLLFAAAHDRLEAAMALREKGADVNDADGSGETALLVAACSGYTDFITFLVDQGASVKTATADGRTPLMCAAHEGHVDSITALIGKGADINAKTAQGSTALTEASLAGNGEIVKLLLEKGADPGSGYVPDPFRALKGRVVAINAKKKAMRDLLKRIADAAAQDGYTIKYDPALDQKTTIAVKAPWNAVLNKLANKGHLFLLIKEKEIQIVPFHPPVIK
jgi:ankyrin repeat protein